MFQGTFALFNRALSVDFRLTRSHLFRFLFAVMILFCLISSHLSSRVIGAAGLVLFTQIIYLNFVFILMAGVSFFATAITEEKEEQTIGLLLMAGVNPISLLLGKSLPRLVSALLLLSVQFPFTLLAITLGGVTFTQVVAAYLALAVFLFCLSNLGLLSSVVCARSRSASTLVVISLVAYFWGVPLSKWGLTGMVQANWIADGTLAVKTTNRVLDWLAQSSVLKQVTMILSSGFSESPWGMQFWSNLIVGLLLFLLACLLFTRFALTEISTSPGRGMITKKKSTLFSPGRAWINALMWKDFFFVNGGYGMSVIKFICYGIALVGLCSFIQYTSRSYSYQEIGLTVFWTMLIVLLIETSLISARVFHVEVQWNTLVSTAMLPQSMASIAYSKVYGCLLSLVPALIYLFIGSALGLREMVYDINLILSEPSFWMMCVEVLFFWHLTALLSTYIKWGALPLAFVLMWVGNMMFFFSISVLSLGVGGRTAGIMEGFSILFTLAMAVGIIISHFLIKERLVYLASR
ncbi:ABC transporter permease [Gimesia fumaroli]|uniref:ABC-2 family transporter protein n=1 Tax=Gimesia fumaroli TaxID=2527976 RepID=A0A518IDA7_9PLAN|nr:ABC transporter permease [Gimesia fumaroli]QDV51092.1 ABC-2 family transporter protein [Gimesia fumaroli]